MRFLVSFVSMLLVLSLIPEICHSEEGWYRIFENSGKTVLIDTLKSAINDGDVQFDTQNHKNTFLNHINHVYSLRDNQNWSGIVNFINDTMLADTIWITDQNRRTTTKNILDATADIYDDDDYKMAILESDLDSLREFLNIGIKGFFEIVIKHFPKFKEHKPNCTTIEYESCLWYIDVKFGKK